MRAIALLISLYLMCGCQDATTYSLPNEVSIAYLRSYIESTTVVIPDDIYICGYVVANDKYGELQSAVVVADASGGVAIELDIDDVERCLPLYSYVRVRCSGLWLGMQGAKMCLGAEPTGEYVVDRVSEDVALNYIQIVAQDSNIPTLRRRTPRELGYGDILSYVAVESLQSVDNERGLSWVDVDTLSGRAMTTVRHFVAEGDTLRVVTDAKCQYGLEPIPLRPLTLSGVVDWYQGDIALRITNHGIAYL
jgi:hypothetical protein